MWWNTFSASRILKKADRGAVASDRRLGTYHFQSSRRTCSPREVVQLKVALQAIEPIKQACLEAPDNASLNRIGEQLNLFVFLIRDRIAKEINNEALNFIDQQGGVIKDGVNEELDTIRRISYSGKDYLLGYSSVKEQTGIPESEGSLQ